MTIDIRDKGARAGEGILNTKPIQAAIDACSAAGGGTVLISEGTYMTGTLVLRSNVNLSVEAGAVLLASPNCGRYAEDAEFDVRPYPYNVILSGDIADWGDYPEVEKKHVRTDALPRNRGCCLIYAEEAQNISITGMGKIDANGTAFTEPVPEGVKHYKPYRRIHAPTPPRVVFFAGCRNVCVRDISIVNSPAGWAYWVHDCDYVTFDRVKILCDLRYPNNDGIHINCSRNVTVSNACIECSDDCVILRANSRSLKENKVCEKVVVTNCNFTTDAAGVRVGFVNDGTIRDCALSNIVMTHAGLGVMLDFPDQTLIQSDYGREYTLVEDISFSNIVMDHVHIPVLIRIHPNPRTMIRGIRRISFSGIRANCKTLPSIEGREGNPVESIRFTDCVFRSSGDRMSMVMDHANDIDMNQTRFLKANADSGL